MTTAQPEFPLTDLINFHNEQPYVMMHYVDPNITRKRLLIDIDNLGSLLKPHNKKYKEMLLEYKWKTQNDIASQLELLDLLTARRTVNLNQYEYKENKRKQLERYNPEVIHERNQKVAEKRASETPGQREQRLSKMRDYYHTFDKLQRHERESNDPEYYKRRKSDINRKYYESHKK